MNAMMDTPRRQPKPRRRMIDHNTVLDLWAQGLPGHEIARLVGANRTNTVLMAVRKARLKGDPRAASRLPRKKWTVNIDENLGELLVPHAKARKLSMEALCYRLLAHVVEGNLVNAVLDDGVST